MSTDLDKFRASWAGAERYPLNLPFLGSNNGTLAAHKKLLDGVAANLFLSDSIVPVREFSENDNDAPTDKIIRTGKDLIDWLVVPAVASAPQGTRNAITKPSISSVRCRFIYFQSPSSQMPLDVSRKIASQIFTYFQVMASYIDFISVFTVSPEDRQVAEPSDLRFSGFRERILLSKPTDSAPGLGLKFLGLGGRSFQLCYNLKSVANKRATGLRERWEWSPRQAAFHHQFDVEKGTALWIVTAARKDLQVRVETLTGKDGAKADRSFSTPAKSFISSLSVHLMFAQWASEDWRGFIRWLEQVLEEKTINVLRDGNFVPSPKDISFVQGKEDETNKAGMMLEANGQILEALEKFYHGLMKNEDFALKDDPECKKAVDGFRMQLRDYIVDIGMHAARARTLTKIIADRKNLIQQHLQADATRKMEVLTQQAQREAITMKIIAVLTLVYLPATFVSTFFSTDVVKYQTAGNGASYSSLAMERWVEVTLPLTAFTFALAGGWLYRDDISRCFRGRGKRSGDVEKDG